jgi:hypothetical protein
LAPGQIVTARSQQIGKWIALLRAEESKARTASGAKLRLYQVSYRVDHRDSTAKGGEDRRRSALVEILESLSPFEKHISTSTWLVKSHIISAVDLANLLAPPLDAKIDFLSVAELTPNRTKLGDAHLDA